MDTHIMDSEQNKPILLALASTYPRWQDDTTPPFVHELSKRLTNDFEVHLLVPAYPGAKDQEIVDGVTVHRFCYFLRRYETLAGGDGILPSLRKNRAYYLLVPFFLLGQLIATWSLVRKLRPQVIHAHWIIPQGVIAWIIKRLLKIDFVVTSHGSDVFGLQGRFLTLLKGKVLRAAKAITVVSNAIKQEIANKIDPTLAAEVISMGVDAELFNPDKADPTLRSTMGIQGPFLLFVGRLAEVKGVSYLLDAMPAVIKQHPTAKLVIVGRGPLEKALKAQVQTLNIADAVIFTGAIPNSQLPKYYASADIFIGPSIQAEGGDTEGFGLTFVEAGMSGAWLIGSDVGGVGDIIQEGMNGNLVKQRDCKHLAETINLAIEQDNSAKASRVAYFKKYDWLVTAEKYANLLGALEQTSSTNRNSGN